MGLVPVALFGSDGEIRIFRRRYCHNFLQMLKKFSFNGKNYGILRNIGSKIIGGSNNDGGKERKIY